MEEPVHGGLTPQELRALGLNRGDILDFSANINPLGPSPRVQEALAGVDIAAYPDPHTLELREALALATGVAPQHIVTGNGSTELIHLLARAYLGAGDTAVILAPTFGEYEVACRLAGARVVFIRAEEANGFVWDVAAACRQIGQLAPKLVFLCNPNNPTGVYLERHRVQALAEAAGEGLLVVDEAYISFVAGGWSAAELLPRGNVVVLRSLTKDHALTGLRLGYALCPGQVAQALRLHQPWWSVNAMAQVAGMAALSHPEHALRGRVCVEEARGYLRRELEALGLRPLPAAANFILARVGDAPRLRASLLARGICVRDCTSFGLPQYMRVAVRTIPECQRLVVALREALGHD